MSDCPREHAGLDRLIAALACGQPLLPDPELGQDVALLAFTIDDLRKQRDLLAKTVAVLEAKNEELTRRNVELDSYIDDAYWDY